MSETPRPLPAFITSPIFPFDGDLHVKDLDDPVRVEPPRNGEDLSECQSCSSPDSAYVWVSERWRVRSPEQPTGLPMVLLLESRSHLDLGDLTNMLAAELGVMTVRLERAIRSLDGVGRVHVNRWGDGSAHLHLWFMARPYGQLQLRGSFLPMWKDILPPIREQQWRENLALVAAWLADFGGQAIAEPPHIEWQSPATIVPSTTNSWSLNEEPDAGTANDAAGDDSATANAAGTAAVGTAAVGTAAAGSERASSDASDDDGATAGSGRSADRPSGTGDVIESAGDAGPEGRARTAPDGAARIPSPDRQRPGSGERDAASTPA